MLFFREPKKAMDAVLALKEEVDAMKSEMALFKDRIESEMEALRQNFDDLIAFLENSAGKENVPESRDDGESQAEENSLSAIRDDVGLLKDGMLGIRRWTENAEKEMLTIREEIDNARKDIKGRINYALARLKT